MKLGPAAAINLSVPSLPEAYAFFRQIGFAPTSCRSAGGGEWLHDGLIVVGLHTRPFPSPTVTYYCSDLKGLSVALRSSGVPIVDSDEGDVAQAAFVDPNGLRVALIQAAGGLPEASTLPSERTSIARCGEFGELAVRALDLATSITFWERLGFERIAGGEEPYPWGIMSDGVMVIGLHQCTNFDTPHITYFSPDVTDRIAGLKQDGLELIEEDTTEDGVVMGGTLVAPGGQRIFVFAE